MTISCRACGASVEPFMSFGPQPVANRFLPPDAAGPEYFFEMQVGVCPQCRLFQLIDQPSPEEMFHSDYAYVSQSSKGMQAHFEKFAQQVKRRWLAGSSPFVVEIGCNDGILLRHFARTGMRHLGFEPATNVAQIAQAAGVKTVNQFFSIHAAEAVLSEHGPADAVIAANVISHIPDLAGVAAGMIKLLKPDGVFIFEEPYLGDVIEKTAYDQIYSEHVFLHSVCSVREIFKPFDLEVIDVERQTTHGGSMRYTLACTGRHRVRDAVSAQIAWEEQYRLWFPETLTRFRMNCELSRTRFIDLLDNIRSKGHLLVGYGAPAKSTTILNYCGAGPELIEYLSDTISFKQGKLSPGVHIPVRPYEEFLADYPDYAVLFAWNHREEILAKEQDFLALGGKFITVIPEVGIE